MTKAPPTIHFFNEDGFFSVSTKETVGYGMEIPDYLEFIAAYKCLNCGNMFIYNSFCDLVESEPREMGNEVFYNAQDDFKCNACAADVTVEFDLNEYAMSWSLEEESSGLDLLGIDDLERLAREYWKRGLECQEGKKTAEILRLRLDAFVKHTEKHKMFVLIVEGKDDQSVWTQFLIREGIPFTDVEIVYFGNGGIDEAVKLAAVFRGSKLKNVPSLLVIDSDNKLTERIAKIKGASVKNYKVLREKEVDSYLLESDALAKILSVSVEEVQTYANEIKCNGKEKLENIFKHFTGRSPSSETKGLIARALKSTPPEFLSIIDTIRTALNSRPDDSIYEPEY